MRTLACLLCCGALSAACGEKSAPSASGQDVVAPVDTASSDVGDLGAAADGAADTASSLCITGSCNAGQFCDPVDHACKPRTDEATAAAGRAGCAFGPGATAAQTLGKEFPVGKDLPFDHIVLTMMENRSFDHYFGAAKQAKADWDVDGFPANAGNPDANGQFVPIFHTVTACVNDVAHGWTAVHKQVHDGKMDGFITSNDPGGIRALGYFDGTDLAYYYGVAQAFGISDRHFCSVLGPTWINRLFYVSASSFGQTKNVAPPPEVMGKVYDQQILAQLDAAGVDWRIYATDLTVFFIYGKYISQEKNMDRMKTMDDFYADAKAGKLPPVAFVEATFSKMSNADQDSEHPPGTPYMGEAFSYHVLQALMASPTWSKTVFIQTYDEHGGFYDHVPPPAACVPDDFAPVLQPTDPKATFDRLGIRVPLLVASPWSKPGYVSHTVTDNTSPMRLVQARHGLPALTRRDANAWPLLDFFDFSKPALLQPPALPQPKLLTDDAVKAKLAACKQKFK